MLTNLVANVRTWKQGTIIIYKIKSKLKSCKDDKWLKSLSKFYTNREYSDYEWLEFEG